MMRRQGTYKQVRHAAIVVFLQHFVVGLIVAIFGDVNLFLGIDTLHFEAHHVLFVVGS